MGRVIKERRDKEMDGCPLTDAISACTDHMEAKQVEQDAMDEVQLQAERAQHEEEQAVKEAELDEKEVEYIRLVGKLDLERAMGESIVEGPATMQVTMPHTPPRRRRELWVGVVQVVGQ
jgi:2-phospho-L-lactate transferase/gluconeogenesis factor (CofD/UPF0052 family)